MDAELKKLFESKVGQYMVVCVTAAGVKGDGDFKAKLNGVIGDSNFVLIGDYIRLNLDRVLAFWFENP